MKRNKTILFFLLFLIFSGTVFAEIKNIPFRKITTGNGLDSDVICSVFQDSRGFIWIGTKEGINRYDGYVITSFSLPEKTYKLPIQQRINTICEDQAGFIWLGTSNGLVRMHAYSGKMKHYALPCESIYVQSQYVNTIAISPKNKIWVGTRNGLCFYNEQTKIFERYPYFPFNDKIKQFLRGERVINNLCFDASQKLWIGTAGNGLSILDVNRNKKYNFKKSVKDSSASIPSNYINVIFKDSKKQMWLGTASGLSKFRADTESFINYQHKINDTSSLIDNTINSIEEDSDAKLWVGTQKGLDCFNPETGIFYHYQNHPLHPESISSNTILSLLADRSGCLWIGSIQGLNYIVPEALHFILYQNIPGDKNSLIDNTLRAAVAHPSGKIWLGTLKDGIVSFDPKTQKFTSCKLSKKIKNEELHRNIRTAYVDQFKQLFFGTDGGVLRYNSEKDCFENFTANGNLNFKNAVFEIMQDQEGNYWFSEINFGLWKWNPGIGKIQTYQAGDRRGLGSTNLKVMLQASNGDIWVGSHMNGIYRLPKGETKFINYRYLLGKEGSISNNRIYAIFEDSEKQVWIGTGNGLNRYQPETNSFERIGKNELLPGKVVVSIQEDQLGRLWLGTNKGLSCFDSKKKKSANFYKQDGLQGNIFEYKVACTSANGIMFFGGNNGLNAFCPQELLMNSYLPNLQFTSVSSAGEKIRVERNGKIAKNAEARICIKETHKIAIDLASDSFTESNKNSYRYRILPHDSIWKMLSFGEHQLMLPLLKKGDHMLEVQVANNHRNWNPRIFRLQILVSRDWNKAIFFYYGLLALISLFVLFIVVQKKRISVLEVRNRKKNKKEKKNLTNSQLVLDEKNWIAEIEQLNQFMQKNKPHRDKRLTKAQLANQMSWTDLYFSTVLREGLQTNFNDFVNRYRVKDVTERLKDPKSLDFTLLAIAEECGFNSKTSFYRSFKKITGFTPREYILHLNNC